MLDIKESIMDLDTHWVVMKVAHRASQYGNIIEEVTFANSANEIAHTYLDQNNMNYARWKDIVDLHQRGCGVIVNGLRAKKGKYHRKTSEPLINADSPVVIRHVEKELQTLLDELAELLEPERAPSLFG